MIELHIPQAGEETRQAKDLVFSVLANEQPLSAIGLVNIIKRQHNANLTYQAIKKAIDALVAKRVLEKQGKSYSISKAWLLDLKSTVDTLLATHEGGRGVHAISASAVAGDYAVYTFTNLIDLDNFWDDLLMHIADNLEGEPRTFISRSHYCWWLLINLGRETKLFDHFKKRKIASHVLLMRNLPLNRWGREYYAQQYCKSSILDDKRVDERIQLNVIGDTVIQAHHSPQIAKKLRRFFETYKSTQEMSVKEITRLANERCDIKFVVFKNAEMARDLREKYSRKV
jgi:predicted transcriptional regulator